MSTIKYLWIFIGAATAAITTTTATNIAIHTIESAQKKNQMKDRGEKIGKVYVLRDTKKYLFISVELFGIILVDSNWTQKWNNMKKIRIVDMSHWLKWTKTATT